MKNIDRLPLWYIRVRYPILIVLFISFVFFRGPISFSVFIFAIVKNLWYLQYENCKIFYIKSRSNQFFTSQYLTKMIEAALYLLYLILFLFISKTLFSLCITNFFNQYSNFLNSDYFWGIHLLSSSVITTLFFWTFHTIVFRELQKESYKKEKEI